jgi:hypothetical protein
MGILTALFAGAVAIFNIVSDEHRQQKQIDDYVNARIADGWHRVANPELEQKYYKELMNGWCRSVIENNPELFYPERNKFFRWNPETAREWIKSEAEEMVIRDGFAPVRTAYSFSLTKNGGHEWWYVTGCAEKERQYNQNP